MNDRCAASEPQQVLNRPMISKFNGLISEGIIAEEKLRDLLDKAASGGEYPETLLMEAGIPKYEILRCLSDFHHLPFIEFKENILLTGYPALQADFRQLRRNKWFPLSSADGEAHVAVCDPEAPGLDEEIMGTLNVSKIRKSLALPSDLFRIIEHNQDANPHFPPASHRTTLAYVRNVLARLRTMMSFHRTSLAKGRTGLAMLRTGLSFSAIALVLLQVFGVGWILFPIGLLIFFGLYGVVEGFLWYLPIRRVAKGMPSYSPTESTFGSTFLEMKTSRGKPEFSRKGPIRGAEALRTGWNRLSPVMKRRFLAIDRTDLAEERTILATYRSTMARARTGLAFTRTGMSLVGLGIALIRHFPMSRWVIFHLALILIGTAMTLEGFHWYVPGRQAGKEGLDVIKKKHEKGSIWDFMFAALRDRISAGELPTALFIRESHSPGIWGTTGLALERTLIAERRNVKARLRTILARSRTGLSFIRTGIKIFSIGTGLLVYFGAGNKIWMACEVALMLFGLILVVDGFCWHIPAQRTKKEFPYCFSDMEILFPDYSKPTLDWQKVIYSHYDF